ncbi:MAG: endopeptidase La, partial [Calditrichaeota bacterium]|nr:endopeptidase La [Calditrichota bacterium]
MEEKNLEPEWLPLLPLKDMVIFPNSVFPLIIGRELSIQAVQKAMMADHNVLIIAQKDNRKEEPEARDFYRVGVISKILQLVKLPNGLLKVLVEGKTKARIQRMQLKDEYYQAKYINLSDDLTEDTGIKAGLRHLYEQFSNYVESNKNLTHEINIAMNQLETTNQKLHFIASHLDVKSSEKQKILEKTTLIDRIKLMKKIIESELEILILQDDLNDRIKNKILKTQKNHFIHEQIRLLRDELGEDDEEYNDVNQLEEKIKKSGMSEAAFQKAMEELNRLRMMSFMSPEASVTRTYLEWLVDVPWKNKSKSSSDIEKAKQQLNNDHYGLREVKERILDYIAVLKQTKSISGPILCLVGPPGVGKTSLGKSVADALGRNFARISLGGVRDEAEIRGHRKTYIGAMPGKVIQAMKKVGTINPVILFDEVDKMASDMRGDPASALLEVLDPEQNRHFMDHFLEVEYDLSQTLFICTANYYESIPLPLLDRMEVIQLNSYVDDEKLHIARDFLLPQIIENHGLKRSQLKLSDADILRIIREYTREPGVRLLHQQLAKIVRKVTRLFAEAKIKKSFTMDDKRLIEFLGYPKFKE